MLNRNKLLTRIVIFVMIISLSFAMSVSTALANNESEECNTFTVAAWNVDGLPSTLYGLPIQINDDGHDAEGAKAIGQLINGWGWDVVGVSEDFNYNADLLDGLGSNWGSGTWRGGIADFDNDTDGLNLLWNTAAGVSAAGESWTEYTAAYASGFGKLQIYDGADTLIHKGFRYYEVTLEDGVKIDLYITHMDASDDSKTSDEGILNDTKDREARESQWLQLAQAIIDSDNGNPIIVMGDTNSHYVHDNVKGCFFDVLKSDSRNRFSDINDVWNELENNNIYAEYNPNTDKNSGGDSVDKIIYINNTESNVKLAAKEYLTYDVSKYTDHDPVIATIAYTTPGITHKHKLTEHAAVASTSTTEGNTAYWSCAGCGKYFSDPNGETEIEENSWIIPKIENEDSGSEDQGSGESGSNSGSGSGSGSGQSQGHGVLTYISAKEATCSEEGNIAYWTDGTKYFSDEAGSKEISKADTIIKAAHKLTKTDAAKAGNLVTGNCEYWTCSVCGKYYGDEQANAEIEKDSWIIEGYSTNYIKSLKLKSSKKSLTVNWSRRTKSIQKKFKGYQIKYSTSKKMTDAATVYASSASSGKKLTKLKSGKKYYVQVRTYTIKDGVRYYSSPSTKSVKIK